MPDVTEYARLIVEAEARGFSEAEAKIDANRASLDALTASYRAGTIPLDDYLKEGAVLQSEIDQLTAAHTRAEAAVLKYGSTQAASASLAAEAQKSYSQMNQRVTALSYAFQDFTATSGDFGAKLNSISNNLPAIIGNLGGFGAVLTVAATAGIAIYKNWDSIAGFWETRNPFPKAANDVGGLKREFEAAKDELEKMDKAGVGNATQLARYNELRTRTAELEKEIAAAQERQAQLKKLFEAPTASEAEAQKERVELLGEIRGPAARQLAQAVSGEGNAEVEARLAEGAKAKVAAENERLRAQQAELDWQTQAREVEEIDAIIARTDVRVLEQMNAGRVTLRRDADTMVAEATLEGKIGPFRQVQKAMAERPEDFRPEQVMAFAQAAPEALKADQDFDAQMVALTEAGKRRREKAAAAKKADDAADKVIADLLRDELDVLKGAGTVDRIADELTREVAAGGARGQSAFVRVKEGVDKRLRDELRQGGFEAPAGRENVVAGQVGDLATQAARAARVRAGTAERKQEKAEEKGGEAALEAEAKANKARIDAEVKRINAIVGPSYKQQFEQIMATNAGNAAMGRPSYDPAILSRQLENQMFAAMKRRGADVQSANLASKGIAEAGGTDLAREFAGKSGNVAQKNLQLAAGHNQLFAAVIAQMNGMAAQQANVSRQTGELLRSINPRAHHQRRRGQP